MPISQQRDLRSAKRPKASYTTAITRGNTVHLPPTLSGFRVGQWVFFGARDGEILIQPKPVTVIGRRLLSSRVRNAVLSHAIWGPRKRVQ